MEQKLWMKLVYNSHTGERGCDGFVFAQSRPSWRVPHYYTHPFKQRWVEVTTDVEFTGLNFDINVVKKGEKSD